MRKLTYRGNTPDVEPGETAILEDLRDRLRKILPLGWSVQMAPQPRDAGPGHRRREYIPDAELILRAPDGSEGLVLAEMKRRLDPNLVPVVVDQLQRYAQQGNYQSWMVAAAYLSPRTRALLTQAGIGFADATGNLRLEMYRPAMFISTEGASSDPWYRAFDRPLRSLKGPTASRVVRALCDFRPPYGVEALARRSGTSLGSVSRVFAFLQPEGLITREPRGPVIDVKWADLIRRWTEDYSFQGSNTVSRFLEPRGLPALLGKLKEVSWPHAVTGSLAAAQVAPIAASRLATIYAEQPDTAAEVLGLRPSATATNVVLAKPFDSVVFDRTWSKDGNTYAGLSQVAADLITGSGRSPSEGEALIRWMGENENAWRT